MLKGTTYFIGIDPTDPYAKHKRPCTRAVLTADLRCTFDEWAYNATGAMLVPPQVMNSSYIMAIDGPQGLSGSPERTMRVCERKLGAAGKSPYEFRPIGKLYAGFVRGSVKLFYSLHKSSEFRLYQIRNVDRRQINLIEVYPGAAWRVLSQSLAKKTKLEGRMQRRNLLMERGLVLPLQYTIERPPSHDELDAAIAAYIAYLFYNGKTEDFGDKPYEDAGRGILREGIIVQPAV